MVNFASLNMLARRNDFCFTSVCVYVCVCLRVCV